MSKIPRQDYIKHFLAGLAIVLIFNFNPFLGLVLGNLTGIAKEVIWDKMLGRGTFEWEDMAYTSWGSCIAYIFLVLL